MLRRVLESILRFLGKSQVFTHGESGGGSCWKAAVGTPQNLLRNITEWTPTNLWLVSLHLQISFAGKWECLWYSWWTWWNQHQKVMGHLAAVTDTWQGKAFKIEASYIQPGLHSTICNLHKLLQGVEAQFRLGIFEQKPPSKMYPPIGPNKVFLGSIQNPSHEISTHSPAPSCTNPTQPPNDMKFHQETWFNSSQHLQSIGLLLIPCQLTPNINVMHLGKKMNRYYSTLKDTKESWW